MDLRCSLPVSACKPDHAQTLNLYLDQSHGMERSSCILSTSRLGCVCNTGAYLRKIHGKHP